MWGVDHEAAWASAHAMQVKDSPIVPGEEVRHESDGRIYTLEGILPSLFALCRLLPSEGNPNFTREFPYDELVRPQHINYASLLHRNNTILDGDSMSTEQIGEKLLQILRGLK